jgi:hypothetical protein
VTLCKENAVQSVSRGDPIVTSPYACKTDRYSQLWNQPPISAKMRNNMSIVQIGRLPRRALACMAVTVAAFADQTGPKPRPDGFGGGEGSAPAPSSLILVLAGLAVLLIWNWWRSRSRPEQSSRD